MNSSATISGARTPSQRQTPEGQASVLIREAGDGPLDAMALLQANPALQNHSQAVLSLAFEEFCRRCDADEQLDVEAYADRFPQCRDALYRMAVLYAALDQKARCQRPQEESWPRPGEVFLGFALLQELGRGSFSRVFLAEEIALGHRRVVVKICHQSANEASLMGQLDHSGIVPIHSTQVDADTGLTVLCMPFLGRITLGDILQQCCGRNNPPPTRARDVIEAFRTDESSSQPDVPKLRAFQRGSYVSAALELSAEIAEALAAAHSEGIIHHDIKPSNVLIAESGRALLFDFNLSSDAGQPSHAVGGTLLYMAPEQLANLSQVDPSRRISPKADVFSLGVTLYEFFSGTHPFAVLDGKQSPENLAENLLVSQRSGTRPLQDRNPDVAPGIARIIHNCLALDPGARPTAAELASSLRAQTKLVRRSTRFARHHRRPILGTLALLTVLAFGAVALVASREPVSVREFRTGLELMRQQQWAQAVTHFELAAEATRESSHIKFARGQALLKDGQPRNALNDFRYCIEESPDDPEVTAWFALAVAQGALQAESTTDFRDALLYFERAEQLGLATAALSNNIGFCYLRINQRELAQAAYSRAIEADSQLQPSWHGLAVIEYRTALRENRVPDLTYIEQALSTGAPTAQLHLDASLAWALVARRSQDEAALTAADRAVLHAQQAVVAGLNPSRLSAVWTHLPLQFARPDLQPHGEEVNINSHASAAYWLVDPSPLP